MLQLPLRVLCVEDDPKAGHELERLIRQQPDLTLVGRCGSANELLAQVASDQIDVLLLEIAMPGPTLAELRRVLESRPNTRCIVRSADHRRTAVDDCLDAGALGYFSKHDAANEVVEGIRRVMRDQVVLGAIIRQSLSHATNHDGHGTA